MISFEEQLPRRSDKPTCHAGHVRSPRLWAGIPHVDFAASLLREGVDIGRALISIGLPEENGQAQAAVRKLLAAEKRSRQNGIQP
jgi:hypothetical protein